MKYLTTSQASVLAERTMRELWPNARDSIATFVQAFREELQYYENFDGFRPLEEAQDEHN